VGGREIRSRARPVPRPSRRAKGGKGGGLPGFASELPVGMRGLGQLEAISTNALLSTTSLPKTAHAENPDLRRRQGSMPEVRDTSDALDVETGPVRDKETTEVSHDRIVDGACRPCE